MHADPQMTIARRPLIRALPLGAGGLALGGCATAPGGEPSLVALARVKGVKGLRSRPAKALKRVLPYDEKLNPKPLRTAIADALRALPAR